MTTEHKPHSRRFDRVEILNRLKAVEAGEMTLYERELVEQLEALRGELQKAWDLLSVEGYADDPDWAGTRSIKDALDASNPAKRPS